MRLILGILYLKFACIRADTGVCSTARVLLRKRYIITPAETAPAKAIIARTSVKGNGDSGRTAVATDCFEASKENVVDRPLLLMVALYVPNGIIDRLTPPLLSVFVCRVVWLARVKVTLTPETGVL